jgi:hypothetical protein
MPRRAGNLKSAGTIRAGADRGRNTRGVTEDKLMAELDPKELLNRILQLKEHL